MTFQHHSRTLLRLLNYTRHFLALCGVTLLVLSAHAQIPDPGTWPNGPPPGYPDQNNCPFSHNCFPNPYSYPFEALNVGSSSTGRMSFPDFSIQLGGSVAELTDYKNYSWTYSSQVSGRATYSASGIQLERFNTNLSTTPLQESLIQSVTAPDETLYVYSLILRTNASPSIYPVSERVVQVVYPNDTYLTIQYDDRGNIPKTTLYGKDETSTLVQEANYPATCIHRATCNKPIWVEDANENRTDYVYYNGHGGVRRITGPAVDGIRPQTRYEYQQFQARYKNSSGAIVASGQPTWLLKREEFCRTTNPNSSNTGCAGGSADEVVITYDYGPSSGPNNLWLRGKSIKADGETLWTCYEYDMVGNLISETSPKGAINGCS